MCVTLNEGCLRTANRSSYKFYRFKADFETADLRSYGVYVIEIYQLCFRLVSSMVRPIVSFTLNGYGSIRAFFKNLFRFSEFSFF